MKLLRLQNGVGRRRGMALLYTMFGVVAAASLVALMMTTTSSAARTSRTKVGATRAQYLAEGAVEVAKNAVTTAIANWDPIPAAGTATIDGVTVDYTAAATGWSAISTDPAGIQTILTGYELRASANIDGRTHTAHRLINTEATPVFQFAVFYTNDLEINPGPNMTLGGRVHTNADLYLNCGGTLKVNTNYLRAVGEMYRVRKDDPSQSQGTVQIRNWVVNPFNGAEPSVYYDMNSTSQMSAATAGAVTEPYDSMFVGGYDSNGDGDFTDKGDFLPWMPGALDYWSEPALYAGGSGHTVMNAAHGVGEATVPLIGSIAMFEPVAGGEYELDVSGVYVPAAGGPGTGTHSKGYFHSQADLSIIGQPTGSPAAYKAYDKFGNDVTLAVSVALKSAQIFDARQANGNGKYVKTIEIDMAKLALTAYWPSNGLVYAAGYSSTTGTDAKAILLKNGATLKTKLTVASEDGVYIHGDYNTVAKKGAAVICDAANLLSKAWSGAKAPGSGLPAAAATTYNVALITGNQDTKAGAGSAGYNGGLENLPRFHENWSGKACNITGSFVNTWTSGHYNGTWVYGADRYTAPNRFWNYDTAFNTVANLPPFTPMAVAARDVCSW